MTDSNESDDDRRRGGTDPYRHSYDPRTDSVSEELVRAVAVLEDVDPTELAILANVVDPDALDALFRYRADGTPRTTSGRVGFEYDGRRIRITADGTITIEDADPEGET